MIPITQTQFLNRVRSARQALGLTQVELAERAGISPTTVVTVETRPSYAPRPSVRQKLARALGADEGWLFYVDRGQVAS